MVLASLLSMLSPQAVTDGMSRTVMERKDVAVEEEEGRVSQDGW